MDTCTNCGATLRPGARFCTTCGTRLNSASEPNSGWGTRQGNVSDDAQETTVLDAVKPASPEPPTTISGGSSQREYDRWTSAYGTPEEPADDPASRFISALEQKPAPASTEPSIDTEDAEEAEDTSNPAATWVTPPPDAFKPTTTSSWSYQASESDPAASAEESGESSNSDDSGWRAPASWGHVTDTARDEEPEATGAAGIEMADRDEIPAWGETSAEADAADEMDADDLTIAEDEDSGDTASAPDAAGFRDGGTYEVDYLSGDENIDVSGNESQALAPEDARARAISLVDELRRMVRLMPGSGPQYTGAAAMALTEASLNVNDFSDVREAITELQDDPRDIQALSNLARMADKIELLLDEHQSLAKTIETAISELSGHNQVG